MSEELALHKILSQDREVLCQIYLISNIKSKLSISLRNNIHDRLLTTTFSTSSTLHTRWDQVLFEYKTNKYKNGNNVKSIQSD